MFTPSTKDWCEPNFVVLPWVAEFWNTATSLWISYLSVVALRRLHGHRRALTLSQVIIMSLVFANGLLSGLYHATLWRFAQFADELSMLLAVLIWNTVLTAVTDDRDLSRTKRIAPGLSAASLTLFCLEYELDCGISRAWFAALFVGGIVRTLRFARTFPGLLTPFKRSVALWLVGVVAWLLDQALCSYAGHWGGHALWHLATGTGVFFLNEALKHVHVHHLGV
jgi:dihydroceramidase